MIQVGLGAATDAMNHAPPASGRCAVCAVDDVFVRSDRPTRENFQCRGCQASLRYRHQAEVLVGVYGPERASLSEVVQSPTMRSLDVYEPGIIGPFRHLFRTHPSYVQSYLWREVPVGEMHKGVRCEDLEALTFADESFDLVLSSDIFEHVRRPWRAFAEILRVLRPGGHHMFTVPLAWPLPPLTAPRVDTSTAEDRHLVEPVYHGSPVDPEGSLVYTDFGMDLPERLRAIGFRTAVHHGYRNNLTLVSTRPLAR